MSIESELRSVKYVAPNGTSLVQDPSLLASVTTGIHFRTRVFELGGLVGLGQTALISSAPSPSYVTVQNLTMPHVGGRLAYNGRWSKTFYFRLEGVYLMDLPMTNDRGSLQATKNTRIMINTHWGEFSFSPWLRLTAGFGMQMSETNLGRQSGTMITLGLSIGNVWGQRVPTLR